MTLKRVESLAVGDPIMMSDGSLVKTTPEIVEAVTSGSRLLSVKDQQGDHQIMSITPVEQMASDQAVTAAAAAFSKMAIVDDSSIASFFDHAQTFLETDGVWEEVARANAQDVERALARGRTVGRLKVDGLTREKMLAGLRKWKELGVFRNTKLDTISNQNFDVDLIRAPLGVIGFVFEGRPNVVIDACGTLLTGNTVVFRIGSDAIGTARAIVNLVVSPALAQAGLPNGAISLIDDTGHGSGWALFSDSRLSLAVARGSGNAVETLGSIARQSGVPVSLHGRGGAWIFLDEGIDHKTIAQTVFDSLDRKVCNTLNTLCILKSNLEQCLHGIELASSKIEKKFNHPLIVRIRTEDNSDLDRLASVGSIQLKDLHEANLGTEWEWDEQPEITIAIVDDLHEAYELFNEYSPKFVASLLSDDKSRHQEMFDRVDCPFVGDSFTRWVDGQFALGKPELGLSNWENGRLFGRSGILAGDSVFTIRMRYLQSADRL